MIFVYRNVLTLKQDNSWYFINCDYNGVHALNRGDGFLNKWIYPNIDKHLLVKL